MLDTKYLDTLPFYKDSYIMMQRLPNNHYRLLQFLFKDDNHKRLGDSLFV